MADPHGWPNASKPGVPLNPERDGWHWMSALRGVSFERPRFWDAKIARWELSDGECIAPPECAERWRYLGPCLTPDEVAAREAAAAAKEREACAKTALRTMLPDDCGPDEAHGRFQQAVACCEAIRARGQEAGGE